VAVRNLNKVIILPSHVLEHDFIPTVNRPEENMLVFQFEIKEADS